MTQKSKTMDSVIAGKPVDPVEIRNRNRDKVRRYAEQYGTAQKIK